MKIPCLALFAIALTSTLYPHITEAAPSKNRISLRIWQPVNPLKVNSILDCRYKNNPSFGFELHRSAQNIKFYVITNNALEGEKSSQEGIVTNEGITTRITLQFFDRKDDYGSYVEFVLNKQMNNKSVIGYDGVIMFTESYFSKDENGKEIEELSPLSKMAMSCTPKQIK